MLRSDGTTMIRVHTHTHTEWRSLLPPRTSRLQTTPRVSSQAALTWPSRARPTRATWRSPSDSPTPALRSGSPSHPAKKEPLSPVPTPINQGRAPRPISHWVHFPGTLHARFKYAFWVCMSMLHYKKNSKLEQNVCPFNDRSIRPFNEVSIDIAVLACVYQMISVLPDRPGPVSNFDRSGLSYWMPVKCLSPESPATRTRWHSLS